MSHFRLELPTLNVPDRSAAVLSAVIENSTVAQRQSYCQRSRPSRFRRRWGVTGPIKRRIPTIEVVIHTLRLSVY